MENLLSTHEITWQSAALRLFISLFLSAIIGLERKIHNQPAGLRTHILICMGSTLVMILSIYIPQVYAGNHTTDPGRIAAQVITGIGFLGAGAIIRIGGNVRGLTTAASIWAMSAVGLVIGAGMLIVGVISVFLIFFVLFVIDKIEDKILGDRQLKKIEIVIKKKNLDIGQLKKVIESNRIKVNTSGFESSTSDPDIRVVFLAFIPTNFNIQRLADCFAAIEGISAVKVEGIN